MKVARIELTPRLVIDLLHLPEGTQVTGAAWNSLAQTVELVTHGDLAEQPEGAVGSASPRYRSSDGVVEFIGWEQR